MNNRDTLELILTNNSKSLGKISTTCKDWHTTTEVHREAEKMKYINEISMTNHYDLIDSLEFEMFRSGTAYNSDDYYDWWRDDEYDWEETWYNYRTYSFFYEEYIKNLNLNYGNPLE
tara:strand:+ start:201 stop:551 length:351 start_codon:yes stop_codon:yes gene_type:complete